MSPVSDSRNARPDSLNARTDSRDAQVLEAAKQLLEAAGPDGFTMDRLSEATGLSRATLYRRFSSREALLQRLVEEHGVSGIDPGGPDIRTRILEAAHSVFVRVGLAEATIEEIARQAEVGPATVYRHFKDREGLVEAFIEHMRPSHWARDVQLEPSGDLETELTTIVREVLTSAHARRDLMLFMLMESRRSPELVERMRLSPNRTQQRLSAYLEARVRAGDLREHDPWEMASALVGMIMSFAVFSPAFYGRPLEDIDGTTRFIVELFLNGLRAQESRQN